jgi:hypothetical protein
MKMRDCAAGAFGVRPRSCRLGMANAVRAHVLARAGAWEREGGSCCDRSLENAYPTSITLVHAGARDGELGS